MTACKGERGWGGGTGIENEQDNKRKIISGGDVQIMVLTNTTPRKKREGVKLPWTSLEPLGLRKNRQTRKRMWGC